MNTAEERAEAAAIDVEGRQARIAEMLHSTVAPITGPIGGAVTGSLHAANYKPAKKTRSDKGTKRPKKAEPAAQLAGGLSQDQVEKIRTLAEAKIQALEAYTNAEQAMIEACMAFDVYLDSLKAK